MPHLFTALWGAGVLASVMLTLPMSAIFFFIFLYIYTARLNLPVAEAIFLALLVARLDFVFRYFALVRSDSEATWKVDLSSVAAKDPTRRGFLSIRHHVGSLYTL